jgi:hypothetical protein
VALVAPQLGARVEAEGLISGSCELVFWLVGAKVELISGIIKYSGQGGRLFPASRRSSCSDVGAWPPRELTPLPGGASWWASPFVSCQSVRSESSPSEVGILGIACCRRPSQGDALAG